MKVLSIIGSPIRNGITEKLVDEVNKGIISKHEYAEIDKLFLQEHDIKACFACNSCQKSLDTRCVIKDDMADIYPKIINADTLVFATPIYWWSVSAQLKLFIDRMYALLKEDDVSNFAGKKVILLMTYAGARPNTGPKIVERMFEDICKYLQMELVVTLGVCTGDADSDEVNTSMETAFDIGTRL
ncbi:MAG: flavodoxin family protein [Solirubrobacterales bacterium]